ncbi:MAG: pyruvate ferredoxin oxidoreductase, partial [Acidobacteriota bacterium]|nr:pyruvate ferredoxin oxidoreductase [Acidobacteriota bacterium]
MDGNTAVIMCERESTDAAGAYPITPSTQMGEYWAEETAKGHINISGRPLIFIEPEGEHAAAAVTAGLSMTGLRAANFSSGQGIAYMHESLYAAVGKRLTYVLNMGCRAMTKATLNVHAGHDDYHCVDDTGFFQVFGKSAQEVCDLNIVSHRIAELALTPGICAQDGFLTTHLIESLMLPERELIEQYLGLPDDIIDTPTPAQKILFGPRRRRIPELWTVDNPVMIGTVQNQDAYMQSVAAQRPYFFAHVRELADRAMDEFYELTGRRYRPVSGYRMEDAEYVIAGMGSMIVTAEAVADYLRETRKLRVGVLNVTMFRPFPGDLIGAALKGRKGVAVLERVDQPLASELPLAREIRSTISRCVENGAFANGHLPFPDLPAYTKPGDVPPLYSGSYGLGSRDLQPEGLIGAVENMLPNGLRKKFFYLSIDFVHDKPFTPKQEIH